MKSKILAYFSQEIWVSGSIKSEFVLQRNLEENISITLPLLWMIKFDIAILESDLVRNQSSPKTRRKLEVKSN